MSGYLSLAEPFTSGYYTSGSTSVGAPTREVPGLYDVAIGGHGYIVDWKVGIKHQTIPTLRPVFIQADTLGEKNINPESLWRASQNTWHKGAGQRYLDHLDSDPARFYQSKGIDPWTKWQFTLHHDTTQLRASANTNLRLSIAGDWLYLSDGNSVVYTLNLSAYSTVAGTPAASVTGLCSDGYTVYAAYAGNGIWTTTRGSGAAATQLVTGTDTFTYLGYVRGRLMAVIGRSIYNIVSTVPAAKPTALFDHPNTDFAWVGFAEGTGVIYAAGYSGDKSLIYRIGIQPDGTALSAPIQAGQLPDGEIIRTIATYQGLVLLGTDRGVRVAIAASNGDLQVGALITTTGTRAFEGQGHYVWFGWDNYDATSTGLGRLDPTVLDSTGAPAYASDLMVTGAGQIVDIATFNFQDQRVFTVAGLGLYGPAANYVPSGYVDSGLISYDIMDRKVGMYLTVRYASPLTGTVTPSISADRGSFISLGSHDITTQHNDPFPLGELAAETFEVRETLARHTAPDHAPTVTRHTIEANPQVDSGRYIFVPVILAERDDRDRTKDVCAEREYLMALRQAGSRITYQEGSQSFAVNVDDVEFTSQQKTLDGNCVQGTALVKLKTI